MTGWRSDETAHRGARPQLKSCELLSPLQLRYTWPINPAWWRMVFRSFPSCSRV